MLNCWVDKTIDSQVEGPQFRSGNFSTVCVSVSNMLYIKEIIIDNEEDGMNYHCQGICGATILPSRWVGGDEAKD